tara:strand:+ start:215 stop:664 length:450 start_codon:yes stop_codon:yes gene_type:complete
MNEPVFTKRLIKEKHELYSKYNNCELESCHEYNHNNQLKVIINNINFTAKLSSQYPFRAPNLFINDISYLKILRFKTKELKDMKIDCLCCKSLTCTNNWAPSKKVNDIIEEFFYNRKIIKKIIGKWFLTEICIKYNIALELEYYIGDFL